MKYILPLAYELRENEVGGKAAGLSKLISYGVKVPEGFVVTKEAFQEYCGVNKFPPPFSQDLGGKLATLPGDLVIVRSSAIGEDSESHSFAGQLDSFVVKKVLSLVEKAIFKVWSGIKNDRAKAYQEFSGKTLTEMGVVIQEYIAADYAGVLFTRSPLDENTVYGEYVRGAGEQLVSGEVTPENFTFQKGIFSKNGLPFDHKGLVAKSLDLKVKTGQDLDIEWVSKENEIYLVQARPITVKKEHKVHWTNTNLNENYPDPISPLLYSIARDSYYHYFKNLGNLLQINPKAIRALEYDFSNSVGTWGNRIYYNMTSIHNILSASPLKEYFKEAFNQFVGYNVKDVANSEISKRTSLFRLARRFVGLNFNLEKHVKTIESKVTSFSTRVDQSTDYESSCELFYEFLDLRFNQWYHASIADFFSMIHYKLLGKITEATYGKGSEGIRNTLIQAIPGLISSQPLNDTWEIVQAINQKEGGRDFFLNNKPEQIYAIINKHREWEVVQKLIEEYLRKWGFRCSGELMFFKENYIEKPELFIELIQSYMRNNTTDPKEIVALKDKERRRAMGKFRRKILQKRHLLFPVSLFEISKLNLIAKLCKQAISSRERVRYKQAEMYHKFKVVVKKIGEKAVQSGYLNDKSDMFYLTYKEIGELISNSSMFQKEMKELLIKRRETFESESAKSFPQSFSTDFGSRPESVEADIGFKEGASEYFGLAASGGRVKARVKILDSVLEGGKLEKGDILVTRQTDPGWAMVFPIIGGLIVERGGALSHGAIVAREFGIPAVIGIDNITSLLNDHDEVIIDGDLGKIQVL